MAAHRYWRIRFLGQNGGSSSGNLLILIPEIEMRTSIGGTDQCAGGTAIGSNGYAAGSSEDPPSAFDNNSSTFYQGWFVATGSDASQYSPTWIGYDFGSGNDKDIIEIGISAHSSFLSRTPRIFIVESSDDSVTWTFEWLSTPKTWSAATMRSFAKPTVQSSNRYWMFYTANNEREGGPNSFHLAVAEMKLYAAGVDVTSGGSGIGDVNLSSYPPSNAFDANNNTFYHANDTAVAWLGYDFGSGVTVDIDRIDLRSRHDFDGQFPLSGVVFFSQDGLNWLPDWVFVNPAAIGLAETRSFTQAGSPTGRYRWRILFTGQTQGNPTPTNYIGLSEIEFRTSPGGASQSVHGTGGVAKWGGAFSDTYFGRKAFDGDKSSSSDTAAWVSNNYGPVIDNSLSDKTIGFIFTQECMVKQLALYARSGGFWYDGPTTFKVQYSVDHGFNWITTDSLVAATWASNNQEQLFTIDGGGGGRRRHAAALI